MTVQTITTDLDEGSQLQNPEGEQFLIGAMLTDKRALESVADRLAPEDFSHPFLGRLYAVMRNEVSLGREANALTVLPLIEGDPHFESFGGRPALFQMSGGVFNLVDWRGLASDIARLAKRRRIVDGLYQAIKLASDAGSAEEAVIDAADAILSKASDEGGAEEVRTAGDLARAYIDTMNDPVDPGIRCDRIPALQSAMGTIRRKSLVIGAGRPGMGKTATCLSYALGAASLGQGVLFISLEMGGDELTERMLADETFDGRNGVPYDFIRRRDLDPFRQREVCRAAERIAELPLHIADMSGMTPSRLDRTIKRFRRRFAAKGQSLDLVVVDYLQLMSPDGRVSNRTEAVTQISNGLKQLAKKHDIGMFALSQLSREVEKRPDKRPMLADLRESGSIEQDADVVVFFFRPEYYLRQAMPQEDSDDWFNWKQSLDACAGQIDFICPKRRNGEANLTRRGRFHAEYQAVR